MCVRAPANVPANVRCPIQDLTPATQRPAAEGGEESTMEARRITIDQLRRRIERGDPIVMVDARSADAWSHAEAQIPGSIRVPPDDIARNVSKVPKGRPVVAYCT